jgi:NAD-dependent dihydropyrimidine dehydrogenase PreA subunit
MNAQRYLRGVTTLGLDADKCVGCGLCADVCPHAAIAMGDARKAVIADRDACMECGACARNCPAEAVTVRSGVGCAAAVLNTLWERGKSKSCCG